MAYQLDIKVAHVEDPFGSFSDHSKGLWQELIHRPAASKDALELRCFCSKLFV